MTFDIKSSIQETHQEINKFLRFAKQTEPLINAAQHEFSEIDDFVDEMKKNPEKIAKFFKKIRNSLTNAYKGDIRGKKYIYADHKLLGALKAHLEDDKYPEIFTTLEAKAEHFFNQAEKAVTSIIQLDRDLPSKDDDLRKDEKHNLKKFQVDLKEIHEEIKDEKDLHAYLWRSMLDSVKVLMVLNKELEKLEHELVSNAA